MRFCWAMQHHDVMSHILQAGWRAVSAAAVERRIPDRCADCASVM